MGHVNVPNCNYQLEYYDNLPYILYEYTEKGQPVIMNFEKFRLTIIGYGHMGITRGQLKEIIRNNPVITIKHIRMKNDDYCGVYIDNVRYGVLPKNSLDDAQYAVMRKHLYNKTFNVRVFDNDNVDTSKEYSKKILHKRLTVEVVSLMS